MPEGFATIDTVAVATALLGDGQITSVLQVTNNFLHGTLGDPDVRSHVAQARLPVTGQADQDMPVVAEESPIAHHVPQAGFTRLLTKPQCMGE